MEQYPEGTTKIYSYLHTRSDKKYDKIIVYGLKYLIKEYLSHPITEDMVQEFFYYRKKILGNEAPRHIIDKLYGLATLGYIPLEIKSFPEGTVLDAQSVIATVTNTVPGFHWVVGFFESLLLHAWYPITVASASLKYKILVEKYAIETCDNSDHIPYSVHDFGYRGCSSEESAMVASSAHLLNFLGTDTVSALDFIENNYETEPGQVIGVSVPASEHSVMCCYGRKEEIKAFERMLDLYPTGIISIVADSYDVWNAVTNIAFKLKDKILAREGKVVFRPDSGKPIDIICGEKIDIPPFDRHPGILELLSSVFGYTVNDKGYKIINPKVGLIYGDGMTYDNFEAILSEMSEQRWASSNLVIGVGGLLLQSHSRDDLGFSFKATYAEIDGKPVEIFKDPITDPNKRSLQGLIRAECCHVSDHPYRNIFHDQQSWAQEKSGRLKTIFKNGKLFMTDSWGHLRSGINTCRDFGKGDRSKLTREEIAFFSENYLAPIIRPIIEN